MKSFTADVQLHSCLSPCGSLESSPGRIVQAARACGLDIIALTDHNTAANCPALATVVKRVGGLVAFYGVEVTTVEEIHVICLFGDVATAVSFGEFVRTYLPRLQNDPERFGDQPVVDAEEQIIYLDDAFLAGATSLSLDRVVGEAHARSGVVIASHIDRPINSLFSQLGVWPLGVQLDACDLSPRAKASAWRGQVPPGIPFIRSSDAHFLAEIGRQFTTLVLREPTFEEFCRALHGEDGRAVLCTEAAQPVAATM
ncbi:MAG: PHP domain-containing protein [bacterium]|nr:PHP domain-containing protein [bacterium]